MITERAKWYSIMDQKITWEEGGVKRVELAKQAQTNVTNLFFSHIMSKEARLYSTVVSAWKGFTWK